MRKHVAQALNGSVSRHTAAIAGVPLGKPDNYALRAVIDPRMDGKTIISWKHD